MPKLFDYASPMKLMSVPAKIFVWFEFHLLEHANVCCIFLLLHKLVNKFVFIKREVCSVK